MAERYVMQRFIPEMGGADERVRVYDTEHPDEPLVYTAASVEDAEAWIEEHERWMKTQETGA